METVILTVLCKKNKQLVDVYRWLRLNEISVNIYKMQYMIFYVRKDSINVSKQTMLFSLFKMKRFFSGVFTPPEQRNSQ